LSPGGLDHATFDLTYHVPKGFAFASTGQLVDSSMSGDTVTTHWVATAPMRNATFDVGVYEPYRVPGAKAEPITLFFSDKANRALAQAALANGESFTVHTHMKEQVGEDVEKSMEFYTRQFGPATAGAFYASESPGMEGLAFPGLIKLSFVTFLSQGEHGGQTLFRAHEVAHQWWGIGVDYLTYHDQWLSEAFANFSALWFVQTVSKDNKDYFAQLDQWRKDVTESRASIFGNGQQAGPISLGYRTSSTHTPGDYDLIIYEKGAWVLHMLRMLMLDMRTMNEDRFTQMMRDFYQTYRGRAATTADFERLVARHMHMPMDWFFREWVDGTGIPTYDVHWSSSMTPDGRYHVHLDVTQENVPDDFMMYVPLTVTLASGQVARLRVKVQGPTTNVVLPVALPATPEHVDFNVLDGVLANVKEVTLR
jgi:aminopeptidase N